MTDTLDVQSVQQELETYTPPDAEIPCLVSFYSHPQRPPSLGIACGVVGKALKVWVLEANDSGLKPSYHTYVLHQSDPRNRLKFNYDGVWTQAPQWVRIEGMLEDMGKVVVAVVDMEKRISSLERTRAGLKPEKKE